MTDSSVSVSISYSQPDLALAASIAAFTGNAVLLKQAARFVLACAVGSEWRAYSGELGIQTIAALKRMAKGRTLLAKDWPDNIGDRPPGILLSVLDGALPCRLGDLNSWLKDRRAWLNAGRGPSLDTSGKDAVWRDAAGVCMFEGCGKRLDGIANTPRPGNVGQLAHIIGADPNGPRGRANSVEQARNPGNVMLICYDHHRLIDVIDPEAYSIAALQEMRRLHVGKVNQLLGQLAWPRARPLVIRGGIAGQVAAISGREIHDALADIKVTAGESEGEYLTMAPIERPEEGYGRQVLNQLRPSIVRLLTSLQNGHYGPSDDALAIFALHDTPVLVLAGRIVGEARTVNVFQRDRTRNIWRWQRPDMTTSDLRLTSGFRVHASGGQEALLTVALSDQMQETWLSPKLQESINAGRMAWWSIEAAQPSTEIVKSPADHRHILQVVREALRKLQSEQGATCIHLILVAPVSVAFGIGQALQAGHHVPVLVCHRAGSRAAFTPAFRISDRIVEAVDESGNVVASVPLQ